MAQGGEQPGGAGCSPGKPAGRACALRRRRRPEKGSCQELRAAREFSREQRPAGSNVLKMKVAQLQCHVGRRRGAESWSACHCPHVSLSPPDWGPLPLHLDASGPPEGAHRNFAPKTAPPARPAAPLYRAATAPSRELEASPARLALELQSCPARASARRPASDLPPAFDPNRPKSGPRTLRPGGKSAPELLLRCLGGTDCSLHIKSNMGTEPATRGSLSVPAGSFRKVWGPEGRGVGALPLAGVGAERVGGGPIL
ncbi:PREDICTED: uncharacterized protein LOC105824898 [Propithecus coquereli]|uniref:uncharacterized protein LOC105824898 n=1 Tax=Propithecus coquereli TaxID=379532 RepID=UPI00063F0597|nr:PREDICTED: uncharacterized protein LOC105824898 [Propithecus coquereli]